MEEEAVRILDVYVCKEMTRDRNRREGERKRCEEVMR